MVFPKIRSAAQSTMSLWIHRLDATSAPIFHLSPARSNQGA